MTTGTTKNKPIVIIAIQKMVTISSHVLLAFNFIDLTTEKDLIMLFI